jgi:RNA polymerase sigma-70 factor (ECF subfamily)
VPEPSDDASDAELAGAIAQGGERGRQAEVILCRRFAPRIRMYGLRHLRDEDRARDLVQTVLVGLLQATRQGRVEDPSKLERFVLGTCRNTALRMREVAARSRPAEDDEIAALASAPVPRVDVGPLVSCFAKLDARGQSIVRMSFNEERSAEDIGALLEMSPVNVRVARHRALAALRKCLDGQEAA